MIVYYNFPIDAMYFILFLIDFIPFLMFWLLRPEWEFSVRIIGLMWVIILMTVLLPQGFEVVGPGLLAVFCIQFLVLIWPKQYISAQEQAVDDDAGTLVRFSCVFCGATYAYNPDSVVIGEVTCQNCGKSFRI